MLHFSLCGWREKWTDQWRAFVVTPLITFFNPNYKLPSFSSAPFTDSQILREILSQNHHYSQLGVFISRPVNAFDIFLS